MLSVDTILDHRFEIEEAIAEGSFGRVYRGFDRDTNAPIAIKILNAQSANNDEFLSRFRRECRLLMELDHPNAIRVYGTGMTPEGQPYVAMELVQGQTLSERVSRSGPIDPETMADYLSQIGSVLDLAHARNVLHRDIKPGNIMIHQSDEGETIKVLDFGIAKIMGSDQSNATVVTTAGIAVGTPTYMSPEQAMGQPLEPASDIYSLGVTVYSTLTGAVPFSGKNDLQTMLAHVRSEIPRFAEKNPRNQVPLAVEAVVRQAMAKSPSDRPPTAGEFARLFADALHNPQPVTLEPTQKSLAELLKVPAPDSAAGPAAEPANVPPLAIAAVVGAILAGVALALLL